MSKTENDITTGKNGYKAFFAGRSQDIYADTLLEAKTKAVAHFKAPRSKQHMVSVVLCEKGGETVTHSTADFG